LWTKLCKSQGFGDKKHREGLFYEITEQSGAGTATAGKKRRCLWNHLEKGKSERRVRESLPRMVHSTIFRAELKFVKVCVRDGSWQG
jgi:hypothetical protein